MRNYSLGKCGTELSLEERNPKEQGRDEIEVVDSDTNAPSRAFLVNSLFIYTPYFLVNSFRVTAATFLPIIIKVG